MELEKYLKEIEKFLKDYLLSSKCDCYILGLSGGVDSSLVAAIAKSAVGKEKLYCYAIDIESNKKDISDAIEVAKELDLNLEIINLSKTFKSFTKLLNGKNFSKLTRSNLKVRMRMCALFAYAQEHKGLVLGTDNMDERYVGYFTKYGDGAADVMPIVHLTKGEVKKAAKIYGIKDTLINKVPSAGLFEGQTDEGELGLSYNELDKFLLGKRISKKNIDRIEFLHKISEHKREPIPTPKEFKRK